MGDRPPSRIVRLEEGGALIHRPDVGAGDQGLEQRDFFRHPRLEHLGAAGDRRIADLAQTLFLFHVAARERPEHSLGDDVDSGVLAGASRKWPVSRFMSG